MHASTEIDFQEIWIYWRYPVDKNFTGACDCEEISAHKLPRALLEKSLM